MIMEFIDLFKKNIYDKGLKKIDLEKNKMLIPIRCFSCNNVISRYYLDFLEAKKENKDLGKFFDNNDIKQYCCRRMLLTHQDVYKLVKKDKVEKKLYNCNFSSQF